MVRNKWELWKKRSLLFQAVSIWLVITCFANIGNIIVHGNWLFSLAGLAVALLVLAYMWIDLRPQKEYRRYYG